MRVRWNIANRPDTTLSQSPADDSVAFSIPADASRPAIPNIANGSRPRLSVRQLSLEKN
jgi:hypothetical protein